MAIEILNEYLYSDTGAPSLPASAGSLIALLKAVLVGDNDGVAYGSGGTQKLAAGWTLEYEDTDNHIAVFRNSQAAGGTGMYARIVDDEANYAYIRLYATMSDIDTGTLATPLTSAFDDGARIEKAGGNWAVFADSLTCYLHPSVDSINRAIYPFGDFAPMLAEAWPVILDANSAGTTSANRGCHVAYGGMPNSQKLVTTMTGASDLVNALVSTMTPGPQGSVNGIGGDSMPFPAVANLDHGIWVPGLVADGSSVRGRWRGLMFPTMKAFSIDPLTTLSIDDGTYRVIRCAASWEVSNDQHYGVLALRVA